MNRVDGDPIITHKEVKELLDGPGIIYETPEGLVPLPSSKAASLPEPPGKAIAARSSFPHRPGETRVFNPDVGGASHEDIS